MVETKHFALYTDLSPERARHEVRQLERLLAAFEQTGWEVPGELGVRLNVVMFARQAAMDRYGKGTVLGYHNRELLYEPWVVLAHGGLRDPDRSVIAHELTHFMAYQAIQRQPGWFAEGLATFFETGRFDDQGRFVLGAVPEGRFQELRAYGPRRPSALVRNEASRSERDFYASSWLLVHYLMWQQSDAFVAYQSALARGLNDALAWSDAFPNLPLDRLDKQVEEYLSSGSYPSYPYEIREPEVTFQERPLKRADEYAVQAMLWKSCGRCSHGERERWREAVALALAEDPQQVQARALRILDQSDLQQAWTEARSLVEAHPDHWLPYTVLGFAALAAKRVIPSGSAYDPAKGVALAPTQPFAWAAQGAMEVLRGHRETALQSMQHALALQPGNLELVTLGAALMGAISACAPMGELVSTLELSGKLNEDERRQLRRNLAACRATANEAAPRAVQASGSVDPEAGAPMP